MANEKHWSLEVSPKDDGLHPSDASGWWEWWYFDADLDNGYQMIGTFHFGSPRPPSYPDARFIEIALYDPEGNKRMTRKSYPKEECSASEDHLDVVMGPNTYRGDLGKTHLHFSVADKNGREQGCDLTFESMVEPYLPKELQDNNTKWVVPHARAKVSGTLTWDGKTMKVKGEGYHDHNWSDSPMSGDFGRENAFWSRLFIDDWTLSVIGGENIRKTGHKPYGEMYCFHKHNMVAVLKKGGGIGSDYTTDGTGIEYPQTFRTFYNEPGLVEGEVTFKTKKVLEFMDLHRRFKPFRKWYAEIYEGKPGYFRFRLEYDADLTIVGKKVKQKGTCWCEYHKFV